jgi:hypothetical protein
MMTISMDQATDSKIVSFGASPTTFYVTCTNAARTAGAFSIVESAACLKSLVPSNRLHLSRSAPHARTAAAASENPA